ncbi:MAG: MFS transporter [bacterium]
MENLAREIKQSKNFIIVFVSALLLAFNFFFVYFINSSFIETLVGKNYVSLFFAIGAFLNIVIFMNASRILSRYGNFKLTLYLSFLEIAVLLGIGTMSTPWVLIGLFIVHQSVSPILLYTLDIFLEKISSIESTGSIRGTYLTMMNIPTAIAPIIVGIILTKTEYWKIYFISAIFLIPFIIIMIMNFRKFEDPVYTTIPFFTSLKTFFKDINLSNIFKDNLILHFFYAIMAIYMPIHLYFDLGFNWPEIGTMFSIMLLPFILFQIPLGSIEDRKHDEKQVLVTGFLIMSIATILMSFIVEKNFILWTALLFISRIGASFVEVSTESYFFRHISTENASYVSIFRMTRSVPYLVIPVISYFAITYLGPQYLFLITGIIVFLGGLRYTFELRQ